MDRTRLSALRLEAERLLRHELETRFPDLAAAFDVRLADRTAYNGPDGIIGVSHEHIDW
jgi:hypothetical protein